MAPRCTLPLTVLAFTLLLASAATAMPMREPVNAAPAGLPAPPHELGVPQPGFAWTEALVAGGIIAMLGCLLVAALYLRRHEASAS